MNGLEVITHKASSEDARGRIVKYPLAEPARELVVVERNKGTVSGDHYHRGLDESKNPERLFVVKGRVNLDVKNLSTGEKSSQIIGPLTELRIYPNVYHRLDALEDCVFIEVNKKAGVEGDLWRIPEGDRVCTRRK
jgi:quercetin dioxygenase-like cupin family protein